MNILGVWDGTPSSACLIVNGKIAGAICEERLSRNKNAYGYPELSIKLLLKSNGLKPSDIDKISMSTSLSPRYFYTSRNANFSVKDYWREQNEYWYKKFYENKNPNYLEIFKEKIDLSKFPYDQSFIKDENDLVGMWKARKKHLSEKLSFDEDKISVYDHHTCHAYYGYLMYPYKDEESLIFTMDGNGDNTNGTISVAGVNQKLKFISRSSNFNLGRIYRYITLLLGMKPADHEYKVMGLAAYNSEKYGREAYEVFKDTLQVDGLKFKYKETLKDHFFYFKEKLEGQRFDAIAYGLQRYTEEILTEWISNGINHTGIKNIIMSGGVAQNIKANKCISEIKNLEKLFIPPGPGDESISIGCAFLEYIKNGGELKNITNNHHAYISPGFSKKDVEDAISKFDNSQYLIKTVGNKYIAKLLAEGHIVARFAIDSAEFGARALGNRSILADPRNQETITHINKLVKMRDFWMPFAPSIIEERAKDYLINPKCIDSRFMAIGFSSTKLATEHLSAGLHPFDRTMRPQIVRSCENPDFHELISEFEKITNVGGLLNTSFNIHGEPIVGTPFDAIDTLNRCGLKHLYIGNILISKKVYEKN